MNRAIKATWLQPVLITGLMLVLHQVSYFIAYPSRLLREQILFETGHFWLDSALIAVPLAFLFTLVHILYLKIDIIYNVRDFILTIIGGVSLLVAVETSERALAQVPIHHFSENLILSFIVSIIVLCILTPLTLFEFIKISNLQNIKIGILPFQYLPKIKFWINDFRTIFLINLSPRAPPYLLKGNLIIIL